MYRNNKLLEKAEDADVCMGCGNTNDGTVVAAHSNQLRDGKGRGIKAHDFRVAYLCHRCHYDLDQGRNLTKEERVQIFDEAHRRTVGWWFLNGHLKVT